MNILIGITGSIAAFKIVELVDKLSDHNIDIILTKSAEKLLGKEAIDELKKNCKVHIDLFVEGWTYKNYLEQQKVGHISLSDKADLVLVAPATANIIGKLANGIADDLLSTTIMATTTKVMIAPAMNTKMYENKIVQENIKKLNYYFIGPESGMLACGCEGPGRMSSVDKIKEEIDLFFSEKILNGKRVLINAGPTIEDIDPVRHISNKSSGKMGYAFAKVAKQLGAEVTLITGPTNLSKPDVKVIEVKTAEEMLKKMLDEFDDKDIVLCSAAVADFKPIKSEDKIKKEECADKIILAFEKNKNILFELGKCKKEQKLIGFALETENLVENAKKKLDKNNCNYIIANSVDNLDSDNGKVFVVGKEVKEIEGSKEKIAKQVLELIN